MLVRKAGPLLFSDVVRGLELFTVAALQNPSGKVQSVPYVLIMVRLMRESVSYRLLGIGPY